jgi:hypothetical protein
MATCALAGGLTGVDGRRVGRFKTYWLSKHQAQVHAAMQANAVRLREAAAAAGGGGRAVALPRGSSSTAAAAQAEEVEESESEESEGELEEASEEEESEEEEASPPPRRRSPEVIDLRSPGGSERGTQSLGSGGSDDERTLSPPPRSEDGEEGEQEGSELEEYDDDEGYGTDETLPVERHGGEPPLPARVVVRPPYQGFSEPETRAALAASVVMDAEEEAERVRRRHNGAEGSSGAAGVHALTPSWLLQGSLVPDYELDSAGSDDEVSPRVSPLVLPSLEADLTREQWYSPLLAHGGGGGARRDGDACGASSPPITGLRRGRFAFESFASAVTRRFSFEEEEEEEEEDAPQRRAAGHRRQDTAAHHPQRRSSSLAMVAAGAAAPPPAAAAAAAAAAPAPAERAWVQRPDPRGAQGALAGPRHTPPQPPHTAVGGTRDALPPPLSCSNRRLLTLAEAEAVRSRQGTLALRQHVSRISGSPCFSSNGDWMVRKVTGVAQRARAPRQGAP